jgi:hypothetical protein
MGNRGAGFGAAREWLFAGLIIFYSGTAFATEGGPSPQAKARLETSRSGLLTWGETGPTIQFADPPAPGSLPWVDAIARTSARNWYFLADSEELPSEIQPDGSTLYHVHIPLSGVETAFSIKAVNSRGEVREEKILIRFPGWNDWVRWHKSALIDVKRFSYSLGLGLTYLTYSDPAVTNFAEIALTPKIAARYWITPKRWDVNANAYYTGVILATNLNSMSARFFGMNLRAGYLVPFVRDPWSLDLMAGFFYSTAFVTGQAFGYSNLVYPQFYPILRRTLTYWDALALYLKVVPMEHGLSLGLSQREIATGIQWERTLANGHPLTASFDFSSLQFIAENAAVATDVTSLTLGISYGF